MKHLLYRLTAFALAGLLLLGAFTAYAAPVRLPDPACRLGTTPLAMLAGGGKTVQAESETYYIEESDGSVRRFPSRETVVQGPVEKLNYRNGVLYYARMLPEGGFNLCAYTLSSKRETVLLNHFCGKLKQVYLVDDQYLDFCCDNAVWQLNLETGDYRLILFAEDLWSFVPTGCGLIYATGSLFNYTLYADGRWLASKVDDYNVDFSLGSGALVYTVDGTDYQLDLAAAFVGTAQPVRFSGYAYTTLAGDTEAPALTAEEEAAAEEAEMERINRELAELLERPENQPPEVESPEDGGVTETPDPRQADPNDPQAPKPTEPTATEPAPATEASAPAEEPTAPAEEPTAPAEEPTAPAEEPTAPAEEPTAPAEEPTEPAAEASEPEEAEEIDAPVVITPREPVSVFEDDGIPRRAASVGVQNIVRRARQMLNVRWTPRRNIQSWGGGVTYQKGVTYTGLPYCQGCSYVPWNTSLSSFVSAVNDPNSKFYTSRSTYGRGGPYYGTDCSAFVSWAWNLSQRRTTYTLGDSSVSFKVGNSYQQIQVGDALLSSGHTILITDVTYDANGSINGIEISHSTNTHSYSDCCYSVRYKGASDLLQFQRSWLNSGYTIIRSLTRNSVSYTHSCAVPLDGDECPNCGMSSFLKPGIDVSEHQGVINWQSVASEVSFAILRVGYTGYKNPVQKKDARFDDNARGCETYGIPYGVYFYAGATTPEQARQEAQCVVDYLGTDRILSGKLSLPVFYDVEEVRNILKLSDEQLLGVITAFCATLEDLGLRAGVYAETNLWNSRLTSPAYNSWVRWAAQWDTPTCTAVNGTNVWQYSDAGQLPGISTNVDLNFWMGEVGSMDHRYVTSEVSATCTKPGRITYSCLHCGECFSREISAIGHNYALGICTRCGARQSVFERFSDVKRGKWYTPSVEFTVYRDLFSGVSESLFGLKELTTRAMLVTVLYKLAGTPDVSDEVLFEDVKPSAYYHRAVVWASHYGITAGTGPTRFSPKNNVTRQQAVVFLFRFLLNLDPENADRAEISSFPDANTVGKYAREAVSWAVAAEVLSGAEENGVLMLKPDAAATRAEIAVMLTKFIEYLQQHDLEEAAVTAFLP
ncbi:MAG: S-layer homology domain-containing protein [Oscillospiraceae bacterium]|nr:S-layer homology domain-containing protein [Oscillospiraceae bacterium]